MSQKVFTDKDYKSNDGMLTSVWGPSLWHSLHTISFNYPVKPSKEQKNHYFDFFKSLANILPCRYCRDNYKKNIKDTDTKLNISVFKNRETLSRWVYNLHEKINKNLGKKSNLSYEDVRERYEHFRARCINDNKKKETKKEKGCTNPLNGIRSRCLINIVPKTNRSKTLKIDPKCKIKRNKKNKN